MTFWPSGGSPFSMFTAEIEKLRDKWAGADNKCREALQVRDERVGTTATSEVIDVTFSDFCSIEKLKRTDGGCPLILSNGSRRGLEAHRRPLDRARIRRQKAIVPSSRMRSFTFLGHAYSL